MVALAPGGRGHLPLIYEPAIEQIMIPNVRGIRSTATFELAAAKRFAGLSQLHLGFERVDVDAVDRRPAAGRFDRGNPRDVGVEHQDHVSPPASRGRPRTRHGLKKRRPRMPKTNQVNWQPISQMPLISSMIDTSLNDTREHLGTLSKGKGPATRARRRHHRSS